MRHRGTAQQEAVARRLAMLGAELDAVREAGPSSMQPAGATYPEPTDPTGPTDPTEPLSATRAPALPVPGRHAARRPSHSALDALRGRVGLGAAQVAVVAVLVAIGMALAAWWLVRDEPEPIAPVLRQPLVSPSPVAGVPSTAPTATQAPDVVVHVAGKVRRPGIVVLEAGARVVDALEAAGGPRRGVGLAALNLARVLVDGEQLLVGTTTTGPAPATPPGAAPTAGLVNLNTAGAEELESLPGVGPVTAQAILDWRAENGAFSSVDQLLDVSGIGEATLDDLLPHVTVG